MGPTRPLVLIGPMASGKSAVGRMLAHRTGLRFIDSDREIVERHGPVAAIFAERGEQAFRVLEADVIAAALENDDVVVALGGGAVLDAGTRDRLTRTTVVYLETDLATVRPRISGDTTRPLLAGKPGERWQEIYDERRPLYEAVATEVIDTRDLPARAVVDAVLRAIRSAQQPAGPPAGATAAPTHERGERENTP